MVLLLMSAWLALNTGLPVFAESAAAADCCADETNHRDCPVTCDHCVCCSHRVAVDVPASIRASEKTMIGATEWLAAQAPASPDPREWLHVPI